MPGLEMRNSADLFRFAADLGLCRCDEQCQRSRDSTIAAIGAGLGPSMVDMAVEEQEKEMKRTQVHASCKCCEKVRWNADVILIISSLNYWLIATILASRMQGWAWLFDVHRSDLWSFDCPWLLGTPAGRSAWKPGSWGLQLFPNSISFIHLGIWFWESMDMAQKRPGGNAWEEISHWKFDSCLDFLAIFAKASTSSPYCRMSLEDDEPPRCMNRCFSAAPWVGSKLKLGLL